MASTIGGNGVNVKFDGSTMEYSGDNIQENCGPPRDVRVI